MISTYEIFISMHRTQRSFHSMGLAWRKRVSGSNDEARSKPSEKEQSSTKEEDESSKKQIVSKFLTSSEWLDALESSLPGEQFFSPRELEQRAERRKQNDTVTKGVEDLLGEAAGDQKDTSSCRSEMTYTIFRKLWRKIRSGSGSQMDCTIVWREIKS